MNDQKPDGKIVIIDFDGTLCKFAFPEVGTIEPNVRAALQILKAKGYTIKIHSCRTATYWGSEFERGTHAHLILEFLEYNKIPYDEIIIDRTMDKPIADVYIDDRGVKYEGNWMEIAERLE